MKRILVLVVLLLTAFSHVVQAAARPEWLSLKKRHDPFYIGPSVSLAAKDAFYPGASTTSAVLTPEYGWETGAVLELQIPAVLTDTANANGTPRIGAGANNRIELDGLFRAWGDTYDYLAFGVGAGFPWQTSSANQNSHLDSWLLVLSALGRVDCEWLALEGVLEDNPWFPARREAGETVQYADTSNAVSFTGTAYFYPKAAWLSPFLTYTESFPSEVEVSVVSAGGYFPVNQIHTGRTRSLGLGSEFAPARLPTLFRVQVSYIPVTPATSDTEYAVQGSIRWLF